jgi:chaperonin GroES
MAADKEEKSAGGIIIPDTAKEKPSQGEVIAVGPGGRDEAGKLIPIDIKAGDRVLFGKWSKRADLARAVPAFSTAVSGVPVGELLRRQAAAQSHIKSAEKLSRRPRGKPSAAEWGGR